MTLKVSSSELSTTAALPKAGPAAKPASRAAASAMRADPIKVVGGEPGEQSTDTRLPSSEDTPAASDGGLCPRERFSDEKRPTAAARSRMTRTLAPAIV